MIIILILVLATNLYALRQIGKVHVLVNSRLSTALTEIKDLRRVVSAQQEEMDK